MIGREASAAGAAAASVVAGVVSCDTAASLSVGWVSSDTFGVSETSSTSSLSDAATSRTRASVNAGDSTSETSLRIADVTTIVPSFISLDARTSTPTESPSISPSDAITR